MSLDRAFDLGFAADLMKRSNQRAGAAQANLAEAGLMLEDRVRQLELALAGAMAENAVLHMGLAGLGAQAQVLKAELKKASPNNDLFRLAGGAYQDGSKRTVLNAVYDRHFDKRGEAFAGLLDRPAATYRDQAK